MDIGKILKKRKWRPLSEDVNNLTGWK